MRSTVPAGLAYVVLWSSGFVGAELAARAAEPLTLLMWRYLVAAPLLLAACVVLGRRTTRAVVRREAGLGVLCQVAYLAPVYLAVGHGVSAGTAALVASLQPMLVAALAGPLLGERVRALGWVGLVLGFAGVGVVVAGNLGGAGWWTLAPVLGMASLSAGTLLARRGRPTADLLVSITVQVAVAAVGFSLLAVAAGDVAPPATSAFWAAVAWTVGLSTFGGYGAYLLVLRQQGATRASTWLYLSPPVTSLWAWLMFGDTIGVAGAVGLLVTGAGVALVLTPSGRRPRRRREPSARCAGDGVAA